MKARLFVLVLVMALDFGTFLSLPPEVRATHESNPLVAGWLSAFALKVIAILAIVGLIQWRIRTKSKGRAILLVSIITLIGVASNLSYYLT